jgi:FAD/FMN-containing dehydrogenase
MKLPAVYSATKSLLHDPSWFGYGNYGERPGQGNDQSEFKPLIDGEAPTNMKDRASTAFGPNYPRLQGIKKKYDPENVFNKWFPIAPA